MKTIIHAMTYDYHTLKTDQYIQFDDVIVATGDMVDCPFQGEVIDANHGLVMPGMINAHSHIYSTFSRGVSVPFSPNTFKELLEQLWWKLDHHLTNEMTYYSGIVATVEHLKNGVTTIIDHHASGEIIGSLQALKKAVCDTGGLRGAFCFETSDRYDIEECITENTKFIATKNSSKTMGFFGLHASFTLSDETLQKVHSQTTSPIHIHVAESRYDQEDAMETYGKTPVERLQEHQLIVPSSLLAHCIHVTDQDLDIIHSAEATIVVNVTSNMNNGVGVPDINRFVSHNIPVVIGNDGISYSMAQEYMSLYFAMHHLYSSPTAFSPEHLRNLIVTTYDYTSTLLGVKLGRIEQGYKADLVILPYDAPTPVSQDNMMGHLLFGVYRAFQPNDVFIDGKHLVQAGQVSMELTKEYKKAKQAAEQCWKDIAKGENDDVEDHV